MKKSLLLLSLGLVCAAQSWAITDNQTYEPKNDIQAKNVWIYDRVHSGEDYTNTATNPICNQRARTAVMVDDVIYVARSEEKLIINGTDTVGSQAIIHRYSVEDGSPLSDLEVTLDGAPYVRFLGVTSIGADNFGHIWVAPMTSNLATSVPVYLVDVETGELTLIAELDKGDAPARTDYLDVIGDITREEAECNIMAISGSTDSPGFPFMYRLHCAQGDTSIDDWEGGFDGDPYLEVLTFYPDTKTGFSLAPVVKMVVNPDDEDARYAGELFYIDCFDTDPVLYDVTGTVVDSFENVSLDLKQTDKGANGVAEFELEGHNFIAYPKAQYDKNGNGCQIYVAELGEGMAFEGMEKYWQFPADSLGKVSDSGLRVHCINTKKEIDDEGNEVITLFTFKAYNGMGIYKIGKNIGEGPGPEPLIGDVNGDGEIDVKDVSMIIAYILGDSPEGFIKENANINQDPDGEIDVQDVTALINLILS